MQVTTIPEVSQNVGKEIFFNWSSLANLKLRSLHGQGKIWKRKQPPWRGRKLESCRRVAGKNNYWSHPNKPQWESYTCNRLTPDQHLDPSTGAYLDKVCFQRWCICTPPVFGLTSGMGATQSRASLISGLWLESGVDHGAMNYQSIRNLREMNPKHYTIWISRISGGIWWW